MTFSLYPLFLTFTLDLMNIFLPDKGEAKVDDFEDPVLAGPEDVAGLEVAVNDIAAMEGEERDENILGKLEACPGR